MADKRDKEKTKAQLIEELAEARAREEELRESEETFRALADDANDGIMIAASSGGVHVYANRRMAEITGYSVPELFETTMADLVHPDQLVEVRERFQRRLEGKPAPEQYEIVFVRKDGQSVPLEMTSAKTVWRGQPAAILVFRDITARKQAEATLRESEERLSTILNSMPSAVMLIDADAHSIIDANAAACALAGADKEQIVGSICHRFVCPAEEGRCPITDLGQEVDNSERVLLTAQGEPVPVLKTVTPITLDGRPCLLESFVDIGIRKQAEEALQRRARQLQTVAEVSREATSILDVHQLLDRVVNLVSDGFGFYHTGIFLLDEMKQYAVMRAASSEGGRRMLERGHSLPVGTVGIVGYVAATNEPRVVLDVDEDSAFFSNVDLPDTRSEAALPLAIRGQVIGVLDVQSTELAAFSEDDVAVLRVLADQLAIAIENARLVERTEAQLQELSILSGEFGADAVGRLLSAERSLGFVYDRVDISPLDTSPAAHQLAVERGERVLVSEEDTEGPVMAVPLRIRGQIIGSLGVEAEDGRGWSPEEIAVIEAVSEQVAQALESAQLFAEAQRSAQQMQALYETSRTISSSMEEEALMRSVMESVQRTLGCELVLIASVNEEARTIGVQYSLWRGQWDSAPEWVDMSRHSLDQPGILADIYYTGRTETVREWDGRFDRKTWDEFGLGRFLRVYMPITLRDRTLGVIQAIYGKSAKASVGEDEKQMLSAFMDQAAVALENVRLFEQTRLRAERERQIYDITTKIRRSPDIATILQTAVEELGQALRADRAVVRLTAKPHEE
jgi:PAS domain S-box-containing protein